jgi:hypothetical protein
MNNTRPPRKSRHGLPELTKSEIAERCFRLVLARHMLGFRHTSRTRVQSDLAIRYLNRIKSERY